MSEWIIVEGNSNVVRVVHTSECIPTSAVGLSIIADTAYLHGCNIKVFQQVPIKIKVIAQPKGESNGS